MIRGETRIRLVEICITPVGLCRMLLPLGGETISLSRKFIYINSKASRCHTLVCFLFFVFFLLTSFCFGWTLQMSVENNDQAAAFSFLLTLHLLHLPAPTPATSSFPPRSPLHLKRTKLSLTSLAINSDNFPLMAIEPG